MKILILGTPKSGTTALFDAVCGSFPAALHAFEPVTLGDLAQKNEHLVCKFLRLFTYDGGAENFDRVILAVRNRFDFLISALFFAPSICHGFTDNASVDRYLACIDKLRTGKADVTDLCDLLSDISEIDQLAYLRDISDKLLHIQASLSESKYLVVRYEDIMAGQYDSLAHFLERPVGAAGPAVEWSDYIKRTTSIQNWPRYFSQRDFLKFSEAFEGFHDHYGYRLELYSGASRSASWDETGAYVTKVVNRFRQENALPPYRPGGRRFAGTRDYERAFLALMREENLEEAVGFIDEAILQEPEIAGYHRLKARILLALGRKASAEAVATAALNLSPKSTDLLALLRDLAVERSDRAAELAFHRDLAKLEDKEAAWRRLIFLLIREQAFDEALLCCEELLGRFPANSAYWQGYARVLLHCSRPRDALQAASKALELSPDAAAHWAVYARTLAQVDRPREALAAADKAAQLDPRKAVPRGVLDAWEARSRSD